MTHGSYWAGWGAIALGACAYLWAALTMEGVGSRTMFVPGATTDGHYQIEAACASCHTPFEGVTNEACLACHGEELTAADDSHPRSTFTDPRNATLVEKLDATRCVTCHEEHAPGMTRPMGVTVPDDYCHTCHADIGRERPSHDGMGFDTCATAGCHNYHDNTALYEEFLKAHAGDPPHALQPPSAARTAPGVPNGRGPAPEVTTTHLPGDAPPERAIDPELTAEWERTSHARAGVNCTGCHSAADQASGAEGWLDAPGERECASCHDAEAAGFLRGRHGMRLNAGLGRMTPSRARRPMKQSALGYELSCTSCHGAHAFETRRAAVDACLGCHDDRHSRAYHGSPHYESWLRESEGLAPAGSGVSCATCHLPRERRLDGEDDVVVQHNQNLNLRPNEKMARSVCLACHGLGFSLGALADPRLVAANFTGRPSGSVPGIEMAARRGRRSAN